MACTINASTTSGLVNSADTSGNLTIQSSGTNIAAITSSGLTVTGNTIISNGSYGLQVPSNSQGGLGVQWNGDSNANSRYWQILSNTSAYGLLDFQVSNTNAASGFASKMVIDSSGNFTVSSGLIISSGTYGSTTSQSANMYVATNGTFQRSTSSAKYKINIQPVSFGLNDVLKLKPVTFQSKNSEVDGLQTFAGFLAEDVDAQGLKEFVQYAADGTPDALAYGNMVSLLTAAIQEQTIIINDLKARIETLEGAK